MLPLSGSFAALVLVGESTGIRMLHRSSAAPVMSGIFFILHFRIDVTVN
jgi:hypothetical protein